MRASFVLFLLPMLGCRSEEPAPVPSTSEADADTDTDTDSDTDSDTDADLVITSVFDIRQGEVDEYDEVNVEGLIVTGVSYSGMHCQDPAGGEYSGIYIYTGYDGQPEGVAVGDEISASGTYYEYQDDYSEDSVTLIEGDADITTAGLGAPDPVDVDEADLVDQETSEPWENVLVSVGAVVVTEVDGAEMTTEGGLSIDDRLHDFAGGLLAPGATFEGVTGVLWYSYDEHRLEPRDDDDFAGYGAPDITTATIYDLQGGTVEDGTPVQVDGVRVTAVAPDGIFVQEVDGGQLSAVYVYLGEDEGEEAGVEEGDEVSVLALFNEPEDGTWLDARTGTITVTSAGAGALDAEVLTTSELAEEETIAAYEGVLVAVENVTVTDPDIGGDQWTIDDDVRIDDIFLDFEDGELEEDATFTKITGVIYYLSEAYRIEPRDSDDFEGFERAPPTGADLLSEGEVIVSEVMFNPDVGGTCDDGECEWIELTNTTGDEIDVDKLVIETYDSSGNLLDETELTDEVLIAAYGQAVIAIGDGSSEGWTYEWTPAGSYEDFTLSNTRSVTLLLGNRDGTLDETALYDSSNDAGVSWQLDVAAHDATSNDDASLWCASTTAIGESGDYGTPGSANDGC